MTTTKKNSRLRKIGYGLAAAFMSLNLASCSFSDTSAASMTCVYNGGPFDDSNYAGYVKPGEGHTYQGMFSDLINVPTTVRQYRVSLDPTKGDTPVADSVKVKVRGIDMQFEPTVNFTLATFMVGPEDNQVPSACDFITRQLRAIGATDFNDPDGGWVNKFLNERFRPILDDVAIRVLQQYDPTKLAFNTDGERDKAAAQIGKELDPRLQAAFGGNYFCGPSYQFGQSVDQCGVANIVLPAPIMSDDDAKMIAAPQRAKTQADNDIAVAEENARKAQEIADQKEIEAQSAEQRADAEEAIAEANARVEAAQALVDYAWCQVLVSLGQDCALVQAAANGDYPDVIVTDSNDAVVAIPTDTQAPTTTVAP